MTEQRPLRAPSFVIVMAAVVLLVATGFILLHWHKDWADQGCQLCHARHLPSLQSVISVAYSSPALSHQDWNREHSAEELETCVGNTCSRSPPASISFV
jgi:hypothetical protein